MSRTLKDAPYRVRAQRHGTIAPQYGATVQAPSARLVHETAVFYAHEIGELHDFIDRAAALGYETSNREHEAYLGASDGAALTNLGQDFAGFEEYLRRTITQDANAARVRRHDDDRPVIQGRAKLNLFTVVTIEQLVVREPRPELLEYDLFPTDRLRVPARLRARQRQKRRRP